MSTTHTLGRPASGLFVPYDFEAANKEYVAEGFTPLPDDLTRGARSRTAIITCIDSRTTPEYFFQLKPNDAWSIRNGGGRANDPGVLRSLTIIQALSELREIKIIHHSNCGSLYYTNEWVHQYVSNNSSAQRETHGMEKDEREIVENSVKQDVRFLRGHPLIKSTVIITGWYYDLHTGRVEEVKV
ncbi:carbonic anhydrase [Xylogone sp. PMI_703]|nr:carbonic anhydrase [Xylogone sp. PMI_703]